MAELGIEIVNKAVQATSSDVFPQSSGDEEVMDAKAHDEAARDGHRKMASPVTQMKSKLVWFAEATEEDLFSAADLLEILE